MPAVAPAQARRTGRYALAAGALVLAIAGAAWALFGRSAASDDTVVAGPTAVVARGNLIVSVTETGEVTAAKRTVISNEIRWPVVIQWLVEEGEVVKKGDRIIVFECRELIDAIESKRLTVTNSKNSYLQAVESVELDKKEQDNLVRKAIQAVEDAKADLQKYIEADGPMKLADANSAIHTARRDLALAEDKLNFKLKVNADKELNSPFSDNEIEAEKLSVEKLKIALQKALATHDKLRKYDDPRERKTLAMAVEDANLALARAKHTARSKIMTAEADRETAKISLDLQTKQLDELEDDANKLVTCAEEEGLVVYDVGGNRWRANDTVVEVGAKISPRQQLMIIPDMTTLLVKTKVYEAIVDQVKLGLKAHVRFDSRPDVPIPARVGKVAVLPDSQHRWLNPGVKVFKVDIELGQDVPDLKPGMTAQVEIELNRLRNVLSVPVATVFTEQEKTYCYRLADGRMERVEVQVGKMNDTHVQILSGLVEGDRVLLTPPVSVERASGDKDKADEDSSQKPAPAGDHPPDRTGPDRKRDKKPDRPNRPDAAGKRPDARRPGGAGEARRKPSGGGSQPRRRGTAK